MRAKNEEQRDRLLHTVAEALSEERGAQGFTIDEVVARFMQVYKMPPVDPSAPHYEATTPLPELGVVVMTSGALYGQTDDGTLVELCAANVGVYRLGSDAPLYLRFIDDDPDDVALAARHAEVVDRVRVGTIRHDGTHFSLDDVREQVWTFMEETLATMTTSGEAERLAAEEEEACAAARASVQAGAAMASYMPCLYPVLADRAYWAFDLDQDDWTRYRVSEIVEAVVDTYLETRRRRESC
jgi:hypothetical protein